MENNATFIYTILALILAAYLAGSIPFGFIVGKLKGVDLRLLGSKNIGATNAARVLGKTFLVLVFLLDLAKGCFPTLLAGHILFHYHSDISHQWLFLTWLIIAALTVMGHNWPCWLNFKGGKGVSTSLGLVLAIYPYFTYPGLIGFLVWLTVLKISGYVSLGSILASIAFLASYLLSVWIIPSWHFRDQSPLIHFSSVMIAILILRHAGNIKRLYHGTENKFIEPKK